MVLAQAQERLQSWRGQLLPPQVLIDLDDTAVRIAALAFGRTGRMRQTLSVALPDGACVGGMPRQVTAIGDFIGDLLVEHGLVQAEVQACLPPAACRWRLLEWPQATAPDDPLAVLREQQPDLRLDWDLAAMYADVVPLAGAPGQWLLTAAPKDLVRAWQQVFDLAGAQLMRLEPAQSCERRAMGLLWREDGHQGTLDGTVDLVLALEARGSWLWLAHNGMPEADWWLPHLPFPVTATALTDLADALGQRRRFWQQHHADVRRWRCWLHGPLSQQEGLLEGLRQALQTGADTSDTGEPMAVEVLDVLERGWLSLPRGAETRGLAGPLLLRLCGLLAAARQP